MRRALAAIMALLMVLLSLACASAETPPSFVLYDEQEEADTAAPEAIREQKTTVTQTEKPSEEEAPEQEETEPGEEDESMLTDRLAELGYLSEAAMNAEEELEEALIEFQRENELPQTGEFDLYTREVMYSAAAKVYELPLSGVVIGLDPGHQEKGNLDREPVAPDSKNLKYKVSQGTQGRFTGTPEYQVNLNVALLLRDMLEEQGATVVMTRETNDVNISNVERAQFFNEMQTDYALRLHCNGEEDESISGAFMLVPTENPYYEDCERAARLLIDAFCEETSANNLGLTYRSDQTGFNWCERMVINIEMGHMTNEEEDMKLADGEYQRLMAQGLLNGILAYFGEEQ